MSLWSLPRLRRAAQDLLQRTDECSPVLDDTGRDAHAARRCVVARPIADVDALRRQRLQHALPVIAEAHEHEVRCAVPIANAKAIERRIEQRFGLADLIEIP